MGDTIKSKIQYLKDKDGCLWKIEPHTSDTYVNFFVWDSDSFKWVSRGIRQICFLGDDVHVYNSLYYTTINVITNKLCKCSDEEAFVGAFVGLST